MKKITKQILFLAFSLSAFTFVSCDNDDATGDSTLQVNTGVVGTIALNGFSNSQTVQEGDASYDYTITLNEAQSVDVVVEVIVTASNNATVGEDFDYTDLVTIPAYTKVGVGTIELISNCENTENLSFTLQIGTQTTSNASLTPSTVTFNVVNYLSPDLELAFDINKSFSISGQAYTLCGVGYDMDYFIFDANGDLVPNFDAATGNCVEALVMTPDTFPDGTYTVVYDIYDDAGLSAVYHDPFEIPVTVEYFRCGSTLQGVYTQEEEYVPTSIDGSGSNFVVTIEVSNGTYTLKNSQEAVIASGRMADKYKAAIANARKLLKK